MTIDPPTPHQVKEARAVAEQTQTDAAQTVRSTLRRWQEWESGKHRMHPACSSCT